MTAPATAQPLKLEVGKAYRTRDGRRAVITEIDPQEGWRRGYIGSQFIGWHPTGEFEIDKAERSTLDLVAEWDAPDADGWLAHDGGECPVPPDTVVEVRLDHGARCEGKARHFAAQWGKIVVAYRVVKPAESSEPIPAPTRDFSAHFGPMANLTWRDALVLDVLRQHSCALSCILVAVEGEAA